MEEKERNKDMIRREGKFEGRFEGRFFVNFVFINFAFIFIIFIIIKLPGIGDPKDQIKLN